MPAWITSATGITAGVVLGLIGGIVIGGSVAPPSSEEPWIKDYQGLVGAMVTLLAAVVAWFAIQRQVASQMTATESIRKDAADAAIARHEVALSRYHRTWESALRAAPTQCQAAVEALTAAAQDPDLAFAMTDPLMGGDANAIAFFVGISREAAMTRGGGEIEHGFDRAMRVSRALYMALLIAIPDRRQRLWRAATVDELKRLAMIDLIAFQRTYVAGTPLPTVNN